MSRATFECRIIIKMINGDAGTVDIASEGLSGLRDVHQVIERAKRMASTMANQEAPEAANVHQFKSA